MIRLIAVFLLSFWSFAGHAVDSREFIQNFAATSNLERAVQSFEICNSIFAQWPQASYAQEIQTLGRYWMSHPEATYHVLSTCQTIWISRYLDPIKSTQNTEKMNRSKFAYYISALDFISSYNYLREEIRLFLNVKPQAAADAPPSPYEVLTGLASSQRQLDDSLHIEMKAAVTALAATGGTLVTALRATKAFTDFTVTRSMQAGRIVKHAALVAVIAWGAGELTEYKMWHVRHSELMAQVHAIAGKMPGAPNVPLSILLDEFYKSTERLGYFYSYSLYMAESSGDGVKATPASRKCQENLAAHFGGKPQNFENSLFAPAGCRDAAMVWIGASQFLARNFPDNPEAQLVSDRLLARAKRTYWRYEETSAYERSLPVCVPDMKNSTIFKFNYECKDPVTGGTII